MRSSCHSDSYTCEGAKGCGHQMEPDLVPHGEGVNSCDWFDERRTAGVSFSSERLARRVRNRKHEVAS